jgi:hypothetical protein
MNKVIQALKAQGIADKDIRTSGFNIFVERPSGQQGPSSQQLLYHASNQVSVTIRELTKTGSVLDAAIQAGANNIYGVNFDIANRSALESQARQLALEDAHTRAEEIAKFAGVGLGDVVSISEVVGGPVSPVSFRAAASADLGGAVPISPGELEVSTQLQVVYAIK